MVPDRNSLRSEGPSSAGRLNIDIDIARTREAKAEAEESKAVEALQL
jgi:hypothetical protein